MKNKYKKNFNKSKILKLILLSPFLLSFQFLSNPEVKAGLEFQWDQNSGYKRLNWFQKDSKKRARNTIFFFLRPSNRKLSLLKINLKIP